jgi:hypothetical protein
MILLPISTLLFATASAVAQAPAAPPAADGNVLSTLSLSSRTPQMAPLPPNAKKLAFSATVSCPDFRPTRLPGSGAGVWITFQNAQGEELTAQGTAWKVPAYLQTGPRRTTTVQVQHPGFALGLKFKKPSAETERRVVTVPPGATQIEVKVSEFSQSGPVSAWNRWTVEALSAVVVP